jgi:hypothetical protein
VDIRSVSSISFVKSRRLVLHRLVITMWLVVPTLLHPHLCHCTTVTTANHSRFYIYNAQQTLELNVNIGVVEANSITHGSAHGARVR